MADRKDRLGGMMSQAPVAPASQAREVKPRAAEGVKRVLLYAVPPAPASAYVTILESEGLEVLVATSPEAASVLLDGSKPAMIIAVVPVLGDQLRELFQRKAPAAEVRIVKSLATLLSDSVIPSRDAVDFAIRLAAAVSGVLATFTKAPRERTSYLLHLAGKAAESLAMTSHEVAAVRLAAALYEVPEALMPADSTSATVVTRVQESARRRSTLSQFLEGIGSPFIIDGDDALADSPSRPPAPIDIVDAAASYALLIEQKTSEPALALRRQVTSGGFHPVAVEAVIAAAGSDRREVSRGRVLVADGDSAARNLLALRLTNEGYVVETASDGRSALEAIRRYPPALVIAETLLAGLDGFALLDAIRREKLESVRFIFLSQRADSLSINKGLLLGAADFLAKPVNTEVLLTKMQKLLGQSFAATDVSARISLSDVTRGAIENLPMVSYDALGPGISLLGRFTILDNLGEGGMGKVFKARDERLEEDIVIKVMKDGIATNAKFLEHFKREIRLARKISHAAVVRIFDFWEAGTLNFVTMEFLEGIDLKKEIIRRSAFPIPVVIRLASELFDGLAAAHEFGVVHRDIKPHNILFMKGGHLKILDFGIAQGLDPEGKDAATGTGSVIGTPEYMSPEQILGERLDGRTDIYSAGVVVYEMLTGRLPFIGEDRMATIALHLYAAPNPPSAFRPEVPPELDAFVMKLLSKPRHDRFPSAREVTTGLSALRSLA